MKTVTRSVDTETERDLLIKLIQRREIPFTVTVISGRRRSVLQNRLNRQWMIDASEQLGDQTPEEVRAYCKLTIGVPILRAENEAFCEGYDRVVKPLPYETKLALMAEPLDLPVTRLMTSEQFTRYLDSVAKHWSEKGVRLTDPEMLKMEAT